MLHRGLADPIAREGTSISTLVYIRHIERKAIKQPCIEDCRLMLRIYD